MKVGFYILAITVPFTTAFSTVSKEELKVASDNSRKLANELTQILNKFKADLGHGEGENSEITNDADEADDDDKVENILLQFQINKLEQELNKLGQKTFLTTTEKIEIIQKNEENDQIKRKGKASEDSDNRLKYREMLENFYHGDHFHESLEKRFL